MTQFEMPTLMMVAHGNSGNGGDPAGQLAAKVPDRWDGRVSFGYMRSQPSVSDQLDLLKQFGDADRLILFPLFFSEGYLVFEELPKNLKDAGLDDAVILPPAINCRALPKWLPTMCRMASRGAVGRHRIHRCFLSRMV